MHELEGDVDALKLIDLDREGLSEYREYLQGLFVSSAKRPSVSSRLTNTSGIDELNKSNFDNRSIEETATVISMLNSRLGEISYSDD